MEVKYYICKHCGNIVEKVKDKGVPVICCGEPMQELKAGVTDAAVEKHVPVYTVEGNYVHVVVGETKHPMLEEHFIEWITLNTNQGIYRKQLNPGQEPMADFCLCDGEQVEEVYAYCNLHGLTPWLLSSAFIHLRNSVPRRAAFYAGAAVRYF